MRGGVELGVTEDKSIQWQRGKFEPGSSALPLGHARLPLPQIKKVRKQILIDKLIRKSTETALQLVVVLL